MIVVCTLVCGCFQPPRFGAPSGGDDAGAVVVPEGFVQFSRTEFTRGCNDDGGVTCPPDATFFGHDTDVVVSAFAIQTDEVTQGQYARCTDCGAPAVPDYAPAATPDLPVRGVTFDDAIRYCDTLGARLPTEAEWECAAGACNGERGAYPWGELAPSCALGNVSGCADHVEAAHDAGKTARGVRDLGGNLREWVHDYYDTYEAKPIDPTGPVGGTLRVVRGGSFRSPDRSTLRVWARDRADPEASSESAIGDIGVRCVVSEADET